MTAIVEAPATNLSIEDPRVVLLSRPMSSHQKIAIGVILCLCMLDGFDVLAITFAVPAIKSTWGINQSQVGMLLASGLVGMAAGSLFIAPLADLIGRRSMVFLSLLIMTGCTFWSAATHNVTEMMWSRVFTGLGIGTMIAVISSLSAEYANARRRDLCLTFFAAGFPLGGVLGGYLTAFLMPAYGWPAVFVAGAVLGLVLLVAAWFFLPEPIAPMIARPKTNTLARVNAYLESCGMAPISTLPPPPQEAKKAPLKALFGEDLAGATLLITSIYFLHVITLFFVQSWLPSLVAAQGFAPDRAALIAVWFNFGGIVGGLFLGAMSPRLGLKRLVLTGLIGGAVMTAVFGSIPPSFFLLVLGSAAMGYFLQGGMMGLYAVVARTFPAHMRVSGTGLVIGVGRVGSVLGPALAGQLMVGGMARSGVAIAMAVPSMLAALLLLKFRVRPPNIP